MILANRKIFLPYCPQAKCLLKPENYSTKFAKGSAKFTSLKLNASHLSSGSE